MNINVREYVRTKRGISKILELYTIIADRKIYKVDKNGYLTSCSAYEFINEDEIVGKSSKNIVYLIQLGDYVNGYRVTYIYPNLLKVDSANIWEIHSNEIKTIVTKEQFERMSYHVKD